MNRLCYGGEHSLYVRVFVVACFGLSWLIAMGRSPWLVSGVV
ncbi:hypothetical protein [Bartonella sp. AA56HLJMS]